MPDAFEATLAVALAKFAADIKDNYSSRVRAQPEDQLKDVTKALFVAAGAAFGRTVRARSEVHVVGLGGRPDIGIETENLLCGYTELKAPGKGVRPERFAKADRVQWEKFRSLPNLIYSDGNEWSLYRLGEREGEIVRLGDLPSAGSDAITPELVSRLGVLLRSFLSWRPIVPSGPKQLAEALAPICRVLRDEVLGALQRGAENLTELASEWRASLFPDADDLQFADAYAQTVCYALLLARLDGLEHVGTDNAPRRLEAGHRLLAQALRVFSEPDVRKEIELGVRLLERFIDGVDASKLAGRGDDPWLYFYEDFLAAYDPRLRNERGVYYTPVPVIQCQVRLVAELLHGRFAKPLGFADDNVTVLDPAAGTGAYVLAAGRHALAEVERAEGVGAVAAAASQLARNVYAFEILVGPYAVAHLRVTQAILEKGGVLPEDGLHLYLTDTLESPYETPLRQQQLSLLHRRLTDEHKRAQKVKAETRVLVCIGNPPYNRQQIEKERQGVEERKGGWVRYGDTREGPAKDPIFEDFLKPARDMGLGVHLKNLYNDYVYFWRWALWKVFESSKAGGIVSFITASSYLTGPAFVGMRQHMRRELDELWIIDLGGDSIGARKSENVFAIRTPVAIAIGVRYGQPDREAPAKIHYAKIDGTQQQKLDGLNAVTQFSKLRWAVGRTGWTDTFQPQGISTYFEWPLLTDLFPWQISGAQFKRTWPIGPTREVLDERWATIASSRPTKRAALFSETRDRKITRPYNRLDGKAPRLPSVTDIGPTARPEAVRRYAYRSLDRQWVLADGRLGDFARPVLWKSHSENQVYLTSIPSKVLGVGPAALATSLVPDMDVFCNRGAKDILPLFKSADATQPNLAPGLLDALGKEYGRVVSPLDFLAYCYSLLASRSYVETFSDELQTPGPRIPVTKDAQLFRAGVRIGRRLIWVHTYGDRCSTPRSRLIGRARCTKGVSETEEGYPNAYSFDESRATIIVGGGEFAPVKKAVWQYEVSGFKVVESWLRYRMREKSGRSSSDLDDIRPKRWTKLLTREMLELLWVLEQTLRLEPLLARHLAAVSSSQCFADAELPKPGPNDRKAFDDSEQGQVELL